MHQRDNGRECSFDRLVHTQKRSRVNAADGGIYTRTLLRVDEAIKGTFPAVVALVHRGGVVDGAGEADGFAPQFRIGDERLLFLSRRADRTLFAMEGGA